MTLLVLYFLPTIVALARGGHAFGVFLLNLFLGWTMVFWWVALIVAFAQGPRIRYVPVYHPYY
jgi:hypothetical protein